MSTIKEDDTQTIITKTNQSSTTGSSYHSESFYVAHTMTILNLSISRNDHFAKLIECSSVGKYFKFTESKLIAELEKLNYTLKSLFNYPFYIFPYKDIVEFEFIGKGSYGEVHRVYDPNSSIFLARKTIQNKNRHFRAIALGEILPVYYLSQIASPSLLQILRIDYKANTHVQILMEFGLGTLYDLVLYMIEVKTTYEHFIEDLSQGLSNQLLILYDNKLCHRDIKPSNVIISKDLSYKFSDFGCSEKFEAYGQQEVSVIGTEDFMTPELVVGFHNQTEKCKCDPFEADQYAAAKTIEWARSKIEVCDQILSKEKLTKNFENYLLFKVFMNAKSENKRTVLKHMEENNMILESELELIKEWLFSKDLDQEDIDEKIALCVRYSKMYPKPGTLMCFEKGIRLMILKNEFNLPFMVEGLKNMIISLKYLSALEILEILIKKTDLDKICFENLLELFIIVKILLRDSSVNLGDIDKKFLYRKSEDIQHTIQFIKGLELYKQGNYNDSLSILPTLPSEKMKKTLAKLIISEMDLSNSLLKKNKKKILSKFYRYKESIFSTIQTIDPSVPEYSAYVLKYAEKYLLFSHTLFYSEIKPEDVAESLKNSLKRIKENNKNTLIIKMMIDILAHYKDKTSNLKKLNEIAAMKSYFKNSNKIEALEFIQILVENYINIQDNINYAVGYGNLTHQNMLIYYYSKLCEISTDHSEILPKISKASTLLNSNSSSLLYFRMGKFLSRNNPNLALICLNNGLRFSKKSDSKKLQLKLYFYLIKLKLRLNLFFMEDTQEFFNILAQIDARTLVGYFCKQKNKAFVYEIIYLYVSKLHMERECKKMIHILSQFEYATTFQKGSERIVDLNSFLEKMTCFAKTKNDLSKYEMYSALKIKQDLGDKYFEFIQEVRSKCKETDFMGAIEIIKSFADNFAILDSEKNLELQVYLLEILNGLSMFKLETDIHEELKYLASKFLLEINKDSFKNSFLLGFISGQFYFFNNDFEKVLENLNAILKDPADIENNIIVSKCYILLGKTHFKKKNYGEAYFYLTHPFSVKFSSAVDEFERNLYLAETSIKLNNLEYRFPEFYFGNDLARTILSLEIQTKLILNAEGTEEIGNNFSTIKNYEFLLDLQIRLYDICLETKLWNGLIFPFIRLGIAKIRCNKTYLNFDEENAIDLLNMSIKMLKQSDIGENQLLKLNLIKLYLKHKKNPNIVQEDINEMKSAFESKQNIIKNFLFDDNFIHDKRRTLSMMIKLLWGENLNSHDFYLLGIEPPAPLMNLSKRKFISISSLKNPPDLQASRLPDQTLIKKGSSKVESVDEDDELEIGISKSAFTPEKQITKRGSVKRSKSQDDIPATPVRMKHDHMIFREEIKTWLSAKNLRVLDASKLNNYHPLISKYAEILQSILKQADDYSSNVTKILNYIGILDFFLFSEFNNEAKDLNLSIWNLILKLDDSSFKSKFSYPVHIFFILGALGNNEEMVRRFVSEAVQVYGAYDVNLKWAYDIISQETAVKLRIQNLHSENVREIPSSYDLWIKSIDLSDFNIKELEKYDPNKNKPENLYRYGCLHAQKGDINKSLEYKIKALGYCLHNFNPRQFNPYGHLEQFVLQFLFEIGNTEAIYPIESMKIALEILVALRALIYIKGYSDINLDLDLAMTEMMLGIFCFKIGDINYMKKMFCYATNILSENNLADKASSHEMMFLCGLYGRNVLKSEKPSSYYFENSSIEKNILDVNTPLRVVRDYQFIIYGNIFLDRNKKAIDLVLKIIGIVRENYLESLGQILLYYEALLASLYLFVEDSENYSKTISNLTFEISAKEESSIEIILCIETILFSNFDQELLIKLQNSYKKFGIDNKQSDSLIKNLESNFYSEQAINDFKSGIEIDPKKLILRNLSYQQQYFSYMNETKKEERLFDPLTKIFNETFTLDLKQQILEKIQRYSPESEFFPISQD